MIDGIELYHPLFAILLLRSILVDPKLVDSMICDVNYSEYKYRSKQHNRHVLSSSTPRMLPNSSQWFGFVAFISVIVVDVVVLKGQNVTNSADMKLFCVDSYVDVIGMHLSPGQLERVNSETKNLKQYCDDWES